MRRLIKIIVLFTLALLVNPLETVQAEEGVGYSVQAHLPENQIDESVSYFNLRVEPNQIQELLITIYNHENEDITVQGTINNASTNSNGIIIYEEQEEIDPSLDYPMTDLVILEDSEWDIPAGDSKTISAELNIPDEPFDGTKLGGFHFEKVLDEQEVEDGVSIENRYAYVIGLQLSEKDQVLEPNLKWVSAEPRLVNHRTAVVATIQNDQPVIMNNITLQSDVFKEGSADRIKEMNQEDIRMAPNSTMEVVIDWENRPLEPGNYRLDMTAADGDRTWEWSETFTINDEAETINEEAVGMEDDIDIEGAQFISNWSVIGITVLLAVIVLLLLYVRKLKREIYNS